MQFIICNADKMETGALPHTMAVDFDIGDTNDVEITCQRGQLNFGMYLICPGTEYGALIEETDTWTNNTEEKWLGNSFRRFLQQYIIEPPIGEDYLVVKGGAHTVMREVLKDAFDGMFQIPDTDGIDIGTYQFDRYVDALSGFTKMLKRKNARINIEIKQGGANEPFYVVLSAVPINNLSEEIEYSEDSKIAVNLKESRRGINHLICLGQGELKERQVVHLYSQLDGSIQQDKKYYTGLEERTATYDYSNVESIAELIKQGTEELKKQMNSKRMGVKISDADLQIGDIVAGRNYKTGMFLEKPVVRKIVNVNGGIVTVEYKMEGEE